MRLFSIFCLSASLAFYPLCSEEISTPEEALFLRRIAAFWEEGEYAMAKHQMQDFLAMHAQSSYADTLRMTLGDLFVHEKDYQEALKQYAQITDLGLKTKVFTRRMQCLHHLEWYATLADECDAYLQKTNEADNEQERSEITYLLAIALYEQCLSPTKEKSAILALAERAKPYFENLSNSSFANEIKGAHAHICCLLQDFSGAAQIYLDLAGKAEYGDEYLFQAALLQSKYDKELSIQTFQQLANQGGKLAKDAAYNSLVLSFDLGRYEQIAAQQEEIFQTIPEEKKGAARLLFGQSLLSQNKCQEAAVQFDSFIQKDFVPESKDALLYIVETAYRTNNLELLDRSIAKYKTLDAEDPNLATASFTRAQILKNEGRLEEAKIEISTLLTRFPQFANRPEAALTLIQLEASSSRWAACREAALFFLRHYPSHELASHAWRHLVFASSEFAKLEKEGTSLIQDLEFCLANASCFNPQEQLQLNFRLAEAYFNQSLFQEALSLLEPLCALENIDNEQLANAELLLALCFAKEKKNTLFCEWAEKALSHGATLLPKKEQHLALFNAYIETETTEKIAYHLKESFFLGANLDLPNLLWLANDAYEQFLSNSSHAETARNIIENILQKYDPKKIEPETIFLEPLIIHYAKILHHFGEDKEAIACLESLNEQYHIPQEIDWGYRSEAKFFLADLYLITGAKALAEHFFDQVASSCILRDRLAAEAALQSARLKQEKENPDVKTALELFKNISLQKTLANEPIHLESAIDYIELLSSLQPNEKRKEKTLDLLIKMKENFTSQEDLLSLDYHAARKQNTKQNQIYLDYMSYLDAKILLIRAEIEKENKEELTSNAKQILQQIANEPSIYLQKRLEKLLTEKI